MKLATENLILEGMSQGETVDLSHVKTIDELKRTMTDNYVVLCRKCAGQSLCKYHDPSEPPCAVLTKVVHNYIDMNIKSVETSNRYLLSEFLKSLIYLLGIFHTFTNWQGIYSDESFNWYYESAHPGLNSFYAHELLVTISKFVQAYRQIRTDRLMRFVVLVEGDSEYEALPRIFEALHVLGIDSPIKNEVKFVNLEGKDSVQRNRIKDQLIRFREKEVSYFMVLDNDEGVAKYVSDLKRDNLLEENHYIVWENTFEDNFGENAILTTLKEIANDVFGKITVEELREYNSGTGNISRVIDRLLKEKGIGARYDDYKVEVARRLSELVCKEIDESFKTASYTYDYSRVPTSKTAPNFVKQLNAMAERMKSLSSEFHVIKSEKENSP